MRLPAMTKGEAVCRFAKWCASTGRDVAQQTRMVSGDRTETPMMLTASEVRDMMGYVELTGTAAVFMGA